jgi:hypothetical protein
VRIFKVIFLAVGGFVVGYNLSPLLPGSGVEHPFSFNHNAHRVMECTICHPGARSGTRAGLASSEICLKCHATSPLSRDDYQKVWQQAERGTPILWSKLTRMPSHVYFSHNRHVHLAGLDCQECHGEIHLTSKLPSAPLKKASMNNCLECHEKNNAPEDCAACHR